MEKQPSANKKPIRKRTIFTIIAIINIIWYTVAVLILSAYNKSVPDSLTVAWFAAWTAELAILYGIKINKE